MNVTWSFCGWSVSRRVTIVVVMKIAPRSSYRRFEDSISRISSRVGTSIANCASTARSSSALGSCRSSQTAVDTSPPSRRTRPCGAA
jgi:hypothetical protein